MSRPWDDCKFYLASGCRNAHCTFRHSEQAKRSLEHCLAWQQGQCQNMACHKKHVHTVAAIACRFEFTPGGCTNAACGFKHQLPRGNNGELQAKLAVLLAEHNNGDKSAAAPGDSGDPAPAKCSSDEDELDLDALRAQALSSVTGQQGQVKKTKKALKRKKDDEHKEEVNKDEKKKKPSDIRSRLGPRVQSTGANLQRRIITTKSEYSEDEVSDLSMDELTDEEGAPEEDLRATLNKNKTKTVVVKKQVDQKRRLIRKINVMSPKKESHSRLITLRQVTNGGNNSSESRPSSSEWIERKIRVKPKPLESGEDEDYSDNSDGELPSDSEQPIKKPKRKPNLAWVGLCQNDSTEESDLFKRKTSSDRSSNSGGEFTNRRITVQNDHCKTGNINARLGIAKTSSSTSIKSRLGGGINKSSVKSRLGITAKNSGLPTNVVKAKTVVSLKREIYQDDPFFEPESEVQAEKKRAEPVKQEPAKPAVKEPVKIAPTPSTTSNSSSSKGRLNSTQDLEAALLNSDGSDLDDLELGAGDIDDDELFA